MPHVEILVGSLNDLPFLWESGLLDELEAVGISYTVSVCSAHRNADELAEHIAATRNKTAVYICAAGWAAALPGAVAGLLLGKSLATVVGIALPSEEYPDAMDAVTSIKRLPPGIEVSIPLNDDGSVAIGTDGFNAIAPSTIALVQSYVPATREELDDIRKRIKPPQFDIPRPPKEAS